MTKQNKITLTILGILLVIIYGFGTALAIKYVDSWREVKSQEYLNKAKKELSVAQKLQDSEVALILHPTEEAYLLAGTAAVDLNKGQLAENYLSKVKSSNGLLELGKSQLQQGKLDEAKNTLAKAYTLDKTNEVSVLLYLSGGGGTDPDVSRETDLANRAILTYNALMRLDYPQAATSVLENALQKGFLNRSSYIALAQSRFEDGDYQTSYDMLLKAKQIDPYYPQIYQQLISVAEKLKKETEAKQYQNFLSKITF